ncbi:hypothetical protein BN946_scf184979.g55 [Trametes cinnabarina]|uniref:Uncharacterized protein n=1 Tax=Pycnoporus cinnabarinus TaxID=5643 RepID=A0A060SJB6_PYCCI|nr:hypothetical protein BN946_scf184979.g55 [Trametes cinnabarina]
MATQVSSIAQLDCLEARFEALKATVCDEPDRKVRRAKICKTLQTICKVVREEEESNAHQMPGVVEGAHRLLEACLQYAHNNLGEANPPTTFAHSEDEPWIDDVMENAGSDIVDEFVCLYTKALKPGSATPKLPSFTQIHPWTRSPHPHPLTTRLSRFRPNIIPTASLSTPQALFIAEGRAQLSTDLIPRTRAMAVSSGGSILALASGSGWKAREPALHYYLLSTQSDNCLEGVSMDPGLSAVPRFVEADEEHQLVFLADDDRVKSFSFGPGGSGSRLANVHIMNSDRVYDGPIAVLPNGRVARAGRGQTALWDIAQLETHQCYPSSLIGGSRVNTDNSWREQRCPSIEISSGSKPHAVVAFADDPSYAPTTWHLHSPTGHMLCGERAVLGAGHGCVALDFEHGGRRAARYLGHGGDVVRITTSPGDPHMFATAASDGYARMFDVRRPLPVLTVETSIQHEGCADVVLVHPDGIPTLFTGGDRTQQVKMWDIRERECVYELSAGNNSVSAMAWDDAHASLYIATECPYVNKLGERVGYRRARIPAWATWGSVEKHYKAYVAGTSASGLAPHIVGSSASSASNASSGVPKDGKSTRGYYDSDSEDDASDEEIDEAYSADMRWPEKCFHKENYFGYAYDAGEHMLFRWHFKEQPDITQLPASTTSDDF